MQKIKLIFSLLTLAALVILPRLVYAEGASFDCAKAASPIEKLICSDQELSALDKTLGDIYTAATKSVAYPDIRQTQRAWLKERNRCEDRECVVAAYVARSAQFRRNKEDENRLNLSIGESIELCKSVALKTKNDTIRQYSFPSENSNHTVKYKIDLDDDGIPDEIEIGLGSFEGELSASLSTGDNFNYSDGIMMVVKLKNKILLLVTHRDRQNDRPEMVTRDLKFLNKFGVIPVCDTWFETPYEQGR